MEKSIDIWVMFHFGGGGSIWWLGAVNGTMVAIHIPDNN